MDQLILVNVPDTDSMDEGFARSSRSRSTAVGQPAGQFAAYAGPAQPITSPRSNSPVTATTRWVAGFLPPCSNALRCAGVQRHAAAAGRRASFCAPGWRGLRGIEEVPIASPPGTRCNTSCVRGHWRYGGGCRCCWRRCGIFGQHAAAGDTGTGAAGHRLVLRVVGAPNTDKLRSWIASRSACRASLVGQQHQCLCVNQVGDQGASSVSLSPERSSVVTVSSR